MNAIGGAAMASRRRRSTGLKLLGRQTVDEGTPETRARLQPPPWAGWPQELQDAAIQLDMAVRIVAEQMRAKAQSIGRIGGEARAELSPWEAYCLQRYQGWERLMRAVGWPVGPVIGCVVDHEPMDAIALRGALSLFATGRVLR